MKRSGAILTSVVAITAVLVCLLLPSLLQAAEPLAKLRYAHWFPPTHPHAVLIDQWCKEVEKRTDGRVKVTHFPGATLSPIAQIYDGVAKGVFEVGVAPTSYTAGRFPLSEVVDLPLGYSGGNQATRVANEFYNKFRPKEFDDVKMLYLHAHGPGFIHTKKPISKVDEVKGLRIKSTGLSGKIVSVLGGTPVTIPLTETYEAVQRGIVDGLIIHNEVLKTFRFGEVAKCTVMDHGVSNTTMFVTVMNKQKWVGLPKDVQQIIDKMSAEWADKTATVYVQLDKEGDDYLAQSGNKVVKVSKEEEAKTAAKMKPILGDYVQSMKAKGLPGDEALKFCLDYMKAHP
jgi:TRAP-type C4-dicarboxylate transport system substrate-binding protein